MWLKLTAKIDKDTTRQVFVNMDTIISFTEAKSAPAMLMALDGQTYPVMESPETISQLIVGAGGLITYRLPAKARKKLKNVGALR